MNFTNYFAKIKTKIEIEFDHVVPVCRHVYHILEGSRSTAFYPTERVSEQMSKTLTLFVA